MGAHRDVKVEEGSPMASLDADGHDKPKTAPFRSWKKKHQKMRIAFDEKMEINAKLHAQEVLAIQTSKRLAVEIDRVLDLLLDVNNTPQIAGSKRIDLSLPEQPRQPSLDIDRKNGWEKRFLNKNHPDAELPEPPAKSLRSLLHDVRHVDLATAENGLSSLLTDLVAGDDNRRAFVVPAAKSRQLAQQKPQHQQHEQREQREKEQPRHPLYPESFLSASDVDNYLWEVDRNVAGRALLAGAPPPPMLPTLAPFALSLEMPSQTVINSIINGSNNNNSNMNNINSGSDGTLVAASAAGGWEEFFNRSIPKGDLPSVFSTPPSITTRETILRNPTSVFNWLKNNAPKSVFMQEGEATAQAAAEKENGAHSHGHANGGNDDYHHYGQNGTGTSSARGRKSTGADKTGGAGGSGRGAGGGRGGAKRMSAAAAAREQLLAAGDDADSDDLSFEMATPRTMGMGTSGTANGRGGKRKRASMAQDDETSPRTKTGAASTSNGTATSRGTKRKRKSEAASAGAGAGAASTAADSAADTPPPTASVAKKARKSGQTAAKKSAAAAAAAVADGEDTEMTEGEEDPADMTVPVDTEDADEDEDNETMLAADQETASVDA